MEKMFVLFLVLLTTRAACGQDKFGAALNLSYARINGHDTTAHIRQFEFKFNASLYKNGRSHMSATVTYINETFSDFPTGYGAGVQGLEVSLNWLGTVSTKSALAVFGQTGMYSGGSAFSSNAMRERIGFAYLTKHSDKFTLGFGLVYARQFYGNQLIPVIAVQYHFDDEHWKLSGFLPESPKLSYMLNQASEISFELKDAFSSYRLTDRQDSGSYIKTTRLTGLFSYAYSFTKSWKISFGAGIALRQRYELFDHADAGGWYFIGSAFGSKPQPAEVVDNKGALFRIGLEFNPRI